MKVLEIEGTNKVAVVMEKDELVSLLHRIKVLGEERYMKYGAKREHAVKSLDFFSTLSSATTNIFNWRGL